jgi:recombination protein RecT
MNNKPAIQPVRKEAFVSLLEQSKQQIEIALPKTIKSDRFVRVALTEIRKSQQLQACHPVSILASVMQAAQLGLEFGTTLGQAYLIPYKGECTLQIGYRGLISLVLRSRDVRKLEARAVYEGDFFEFEFGTESKITHKPCGDTRNLTHVYAVATFPDGTTQFDVMTRYQIEEVRDKYSKAKEKDTWTKSFDEMAKKTVVRRIVKMLPISAEVGEALDYEGPIEEEAKKPEPARMQRVIEAQPVMSDAQAKQAFLDYDKAIAAAKAAGIAEEEFWVPESPEDAIGITHQINERIEECKTTKSKTESRA